MVYNQSPESTLKIIVIRHGQTNSNKGKILQGHLDIPLNAEGIAQSVRTGKFLANSHVKPDAVWSSDLQRCKQTAKAVLQEIPGNYHTLYTERLRERNMGEVQGMTIGEANQYAAAHGKTLHDFGESHKSCVTRLNHAWDEIVDTSIAMDYDYVLVFSHGGVISKFIAHSVNDKGYKMSELVTLEKLRVPHNCSLTIVDIDKKTRQGVLQDFGNADHLSATEEVEQNAL